MRTFTLELQDATHYETIERVSSFVGEDASGSFGILAGHARMMTPLVFGLARFRTESGDWEYLAFPGALLYFANNVLRISSRRYLRDADYERITATLEAQLLTEEEQLRKTRQQLHQMEENMLKRLWKLGREGMV